MHELTRTQARRIAVRAQLLDRARPADLHDTVRRLSLLQYDAVAAVAPSADLVVWSRLGSSYSPAELTEAIEDRTLVELRGMIRPAEDLALYRAEMAAWPNYGDVPAWRDAQSEWVSANESFRQDILDRLDGDGPLVSRELPDSCEVPWKSSGWNNNRNVAMMLEMLVLTGEVAVSGHSGRERLWDLADRVYPKTPTIAIDEAVRRRNERRLQSLGLVRAHTTETPIEPNDVGEVGEPAVVQGVKGTWRVDPAQLEQPFAGRAALLSPLDRLVYDRKRMAELFESDYQLEMFKPAAKRRWGYWALPILYSDRLVGKLDATADRSVGVLWINAIHQDVPFTKAMTAAVDREITDLARWLELELARPA